MPFHSFQFHWQIFVACSLLHFVLRGPPSYGDGLRSTVMSFSFRSGILDCRQHHFISLLCYDIMCRIKFCKFLIVEIRKLKLALV